MNARFFSFVVAVGVLGLPIASAAAEPAPAPGAPTGASDAATITEGEVVVDAPPAPPMTVLVPGPPPLAPSAVMQPEIPTMTRHGRPMRPNRARSRVVTRMAGAELATGLILGGLALSIEVCVVADCNDARSWSLAPLAGLAVGTTAGILAAHEGVSPAQALAVNTGLFMGSWLGYAIAATTVGRDANGDVHDHGRVVAGVMVMQVGGALLMFGLDRALEFGAGELATANGLGGWATMLTVLSISAARDGLGSNGDAGYLRRFHAGLLSATLVGMIGGGVLGRRLDLTRGSVFAMHATGLLGAGLACLIALAAKGDDLSSRGASIAAVTGGAAGLVGGVFLARKWSSPSGLALDVSPTMGGAFASLSAPLR